MSTPVFINTDATTTEQDLVNYFEELTGKTLYPAQDERILIHLIAYQATLNKIAANEAALLNLVDFSKYPVIDYLGALVETPRLSAQSAVSTLKVYLTGVQTYDVVIPKDNTRIETKDGKVVFYATDDLTINAGTLSGEIAIQAETAGIIGNGYLSGEVKNLLSPIPDVDRVENITTTSGGADEEDNESYKARIKTAPEQFSVAGPEGAYKYFAKSAHQSIIDVAVTAPDEPASLTYKIGETTHNVTDEGVNSFTGSHITSSAINYKTGAVNVIFDQAVSEITCTVPRGGKINVYPLTKTGNPSTEIKELVENKIENKTPLTDFVSILDPERVDFEISGQLTLYTWADSIVVLAEKDTRINAYIAEMKSKLGKNIVKNQIIALLNSIDGVYNINLDNPNDTDITEYQWANCTSFNITIGGYVNE